MSSSTPTIPPALARFWSATLGWRITVEAPDEVAVNPPGDHPPGLLFVPVADDKTVPDRVHLDVASRSAAEQAGTVERLVALGAGRAGRSGGQRAVRPLPPLVDPDPETPSP